MLFSSPEFLWMLPLVFLPLLLNRRRDEKWEVRAWSSMNFLASAMKPIAKKNKRHRRIKIFVRMSLLLTTILILAKPQISEAEIFFPHSAEKAKHTKIFDGTNSPYVARALEILRPENIMNEVFILGEKAENVLARGEIEKQLETKLCFENFSTPREMSLEIPNSKHPLIAPLLPHCEKFRLILQKIWVAENSQTQITKIKPILAARDENGNQFSIISEIIESKVNNSRTTRKILWHTSPDESYSSLATSVIFLPLLDKSMNIACGEFENHQQKSKTILSARYLEIGLLACAGVFLITDFFLRKL